MSRYGELLQEADWKSEKHAPSIECPDSVSAGSVVKISASVGKEIAHPNTTEHHIEWIELHFKPDNEKFSRQLSVSRFTSHGESAAGPNEGCAYTEPSCEVAVKLTQPGTLYATSYCNIHGLWESQKRIEIA